MSFVVGGMAAAIGTLVLLSTPDCETRAPEEIFDVLEVIKRPNSSSILEVYFSEGLLDAPMFGFRLREADAKPSVCEYGLEMDSKPFAVEIDNQKHCFVITARIGTHSERYKNRFWTALFGKDRVTLADQDQWSEDFDGEQICFAYKEIK